MYPIFASKLYFITTKSSIWDEYEDNFIYALLYEGFFYKTNDPSASIHLGMKINSEQDDLSRKLSWIGKGLNTVASLSDTATFVVFLSAL